MLSPNWLQSLFRSRTVDYALFDLLLIALATMYAAHVITDTDGPFNVFHRLRDLMRRWLGGLLDCVICTAFWVALVLFLIYAFAPALIWVLAIAGAALAVRAYTGVKHG